MAFVFVCIVLLGYVRPASCASFVVAWLGPLPTTVCRLLRSTLLTSRDTKCRECSTGVHEGLHQHSSDCLTWSSCRWF